MARSNHANPRVCHGQLCIKATRVMVSVVLADMAVGEPFETIMNGYHIGLGRYQSTP